MSNRIFNNHLEVSDLYFDFNSNVKKHVDNLNIDNFNPDYQSGNTAFKIMWQGGIGKDKSSYFRIYVDILYTIKDKSVLFKVISENKIDNSFNWKYKDIEKFVYNNMNTALLPPLRKGNHILFNIILDSNYGTETFIPDLYNLYMKQSKSKK